MATRRLFDGAQIELEILPIVGTSSVSSIFWLNVGGIWKQAVTWIKVAGVWKTTTPYIKVAGVWK
jgi:hypothetical protein